MKEAVLAAATVLAPALAAWPPKPQRLGDLRSRLLDADQVPSPFRWSCLSREWRRSCHRRDPLGGRVYAIAASLVAARKRGFSGFARIEWPDEGHGARQVAGVGGRRRWMRRPPY